MKRLLILFVVPVLTLVTACQREPMSKDSVFVIDTEALYTELGLMDEIRIQLNLGTGVIVDSVFVYGESGNLVDKAGSVSSRLEQVSMNMQGLENGNYTLVAFQYFKSKDGQSVWFTTDVNNLSNLTIQYADVLIDGVCALGIATESITVQHGSIEKTVTPKAAGSIIDFQLDDYVKGSLVPEGHELPPVWLYGDKSIVGLYPGRGEDGRWIVLPDQPEVIGMLEEGESHKKYFTLMNGNDSAISVLVVVDASFNWIYYQKTMNLSCGSNLVCYYDFSPDTFYYGYLGTPEGAKEFKEEQAKGDCALYPYIQWGASKADVDRYLKSIQQETFQDGSITVTENGSYVNYNTAPGLSETYSFRSKDANDLYGVSLSFEGGETMGKVRSSMEKQGYRYLGWIIDFFDILHFYLSPDGQNEFVIYNDSHIKWVPRGNESWRAYFFPVRQEDMDMLGVVL